jgi:hypothetical protein
MKNQWNGPRAVILVKVVNVYQVLGVGMLSST